jgi:hypothetical protein
MEESLVLNSRKTRMIDVLAIHEVSLLNSFLSSYHLLVGVGEISIVERESVVVGLST